MRKIFQTYGLFNSLYLLYFIILAPLNNYEKIPQFFTYPWLLTNTGIFLLVGFSDLLWVEFWEGDLKFIGGTKMSPISVHHLYFKK